MIKVIVTLIMVGLIVWTFVRLMDGRRGRGTATGLGGGYGTPRVTGPDDDPDFLWDLERRKRRQAKSDGEDGTDDSGEPENSA